MLPLSAFLPSLKEVNDDEDEFLGGGVSRDGGRDVEGVIYFNLDILISLREMLVPVIGI